MMHVKYTSLSLKNEEENNLEISNKDGFSTHFATNVDWMEKFAFLFHFVSFLNYFSTIVYTLYIHLSKLVMQHYQQPILIVTIS